MGLVLALGVNLWVVAVAMPLLLGVHADALGGLRGLAIAAGALVPLAALGMGVWRGLMPLVLVAFPVLALGPAALVPAEIAARLSPPLASLLVAVSLIGYLVAAAAALTRRERAAAPAPPVTTRRLVQDPTPSRWRRRLRVYRGLTAVAIVFPAVLLAGVDLWPSFTRALEASFGAQLARAQALVTVGVGLLWVVLARSYVLGPLHAHLQHDRDLLAAMESDRRHARRGRPRPAFYLAVAVALGAMIAVVWQRSR
jgi:hypothetical protein